ncbi:Substance-K receptor [Exaiptasia diaphana]|nr:Substance-K receptor [Exaiptasia diaphana]
MISSFFPLSQSETIKFNSNIGNETTSLQDKLMRAKEVDGRTKAVLISMTAIGSLSSLVSNSIIIHSVRVNRYMHTTTNYFIVNMACADILLAVAGTPYTIAFTISWFAWFPGLLGWVTCVAYTVFRFTISFCSTFSLVVISADRLMAVSRPMKYKNYVSSSKYLVMLTWLVSVGLALSTIGGQDLVTLQGEESTYCFPNNSTKVLIVVFAGILSPLILVIMLCFAIGYKVWKRKVPGEAGQQAADRTSRKVNYMIISVALAFILTSGALFISSSLFLHYPSVFIVGILFPISYSFTYLNGLFNIVIFYVFSENYRSACRALFSSVRSMFPRRALVSTTTISETMSPVVGVVNLVDLRPMNSDQL